MGEVIDFTAAKQRKIIRAEATRRGIRLTDEQVERFRKEIVESNGGWDAPQDQEPTAAEVEQKAPGGDGWLPYYCDPDNERRGSKFDRGLDVVEIAKRVRKELKSADLPVGLKWSVTIKRFSGGQSIDVALTEWPRSIPAFNPEYIRVRLDHPDDWYLDEHRRGFQGTRSTELKRALEVAEQILQAYNRDNSDSMSDYFDVHFYGHTSIHWKLEERLYQDAVTAVKFSGRDGAVERAADRADFAVMLRRERDRAAERADFAVMLRRERDRAAERADFAVMLRRERDRAAGAAREWLMLDKDKPLLIDLFGPSSDGWDDRDFAIAEALQESVYAVSPLYDGAGYIVRKAPFDAGRPPYLDDWCSPVSDVQDWDFGRVIGVDGEDVTVLADCDGRLLEFVYAPHELLLHVHDAPGQMEMAFTPARAEDDPRVLEYVEAIGEAAGWPPRKRVPADWHRRFIKAVDARDVAYLQMILHRANPTSKKFFTRLTGVKLPRTDKGTREALSAWVVAESLTKQSGVPAGRLEVVVIK
jgi:hypothetical protein